MSDPHWALHWDPDTQAVRSRACSCAIGADHTDADAEVTADE